MKDNTFKDREYIVERLREARDLSGLDQVDVARELGTTQSYISKVESGQRKITAVQLQKFAAIYGKALPYFLGALKKSFIEKTKTLNRVEIIAENLRDNFGTIKNAAQGMEVFPCVKSNAYGHGLLEVVEILEKFTPPYFAVDSYFEALTIRSISDVAVLIMGDNNPANIAVVAQKGFTMTATSTHFLQSIADTGSPVKIHLFLNTGMNREGLRGPEIEDVLRILHDNPQITLDGLFSHFADADGDDDVFTLVQEELFNEFITQFADAGFSPRWIHLGNSAGFQKTQDPRINACRTGLALYGISPLMEHDEKCAGLESLRPVLRLISTITDIQELEAGEFVGYNCTYRSDAPTTIGLLPLGYHEALDRKLSGSGHVKYGDCFPEIVGRISMNMTSIDLTGTNAKIGDEVTVISEIPKDPNSVENIAKVIDSIPYEVLTRVDTSLRRVVV